MKTLFPFGIGGKGKSSAIRMPAGQCNKRIVDDIDNRLCRGINEVKAIKPETDLPHLSVARTIWNEKPNLDMAVEIWIFASRADHSIFS